MATCRTPRTTSSVWTLERPWLDNHPDTSSIPAGIYAGFRFQGKRPYDVFKLDGVPNRSDIELHIGNLPFNSEGCILLGSNVGQVSGLPGIVGSSVAFAKFMSRCTGADEHRSL